MFMKKNMKLINYFLSIGLTLLVVIFLISIITISRFVFSDVTPIGEHVINTKILLDDVNEVQKSKEEGVNVSLTADDFLRVSHLSLNITDFAYINVNEDKSIVTMFIDSEIGNIENTTYYVKIKDYGTLQRGEPVVYVGDWYRTAEFLSIRGTNAIVIDYEDDALVEIKVDDLVGRVLYQRK